MDYSKLKRDDFVYLNINESFITAKLTPIKIETIVTIKNSTERFYVYETSKNVQPVTYTAQFSPLIIPILFFYLGGLYLFKFTMNTSFILSVVVILLSWIAAYCCGKAFRLILGAKTIDVTKLEKISSEEIVEKHMEGIKRIFKIHLIISLLFVVIPFSIFMDLTTIQSILSSLFSIISGVILNMSYLDFYNRFVAMKEIEKEYDDKYRKAPDYYMHNPLAFNLLPKNEFIYLTMITKPATFLLEYPDVSTIVTFRNNNQKFLIHEKGRNLKDLKNDTNKFNFAQNLRNFKAPITLTFYRRTISVISWIIYFLLVFFLPSTIINNGYINTLLISIPIINGFYYLYILTNSIDGTKKVDVRNLKVISTTEIKETYLKKIQQNILIDFLYSFVWVFFLIFTPFNVASNVIFVVSLGIGAIVLMLILRFMNIYRRVVAVRKIEKEYRESLS